MNVATGRRAGVAGPSPSAGGAGRWALCLVAWLAACGAPGSESDTDGSVSEADILPWPARRDPLHAGCDLSGTWAIRFTIPVQWKGTLVLEPGTGMVQQWAKATRTHDGLTLRDSLQVCGVSTPDNQARSTFHHERYGVVFPAATFDAQTLPTFAVTTALQHNAPGTAFVTQSVAVLLGLQLDDAARAVWPRRAGQLHAIDADADGKPGVTVVAKAYPPYVAPPVNMLRSRRAARFHIALRNVVEKVEGTLSSCDRMQGRATIPVLAGKAAINSRIVGCDRTDGQPCSADEYLQIDKLQSGYDLNGEASVIMQRIDPALSCSAVAELPF